MILETPERKQRGKEREIQNMKWPLADPDERSQAGKLPQMITNPIRLSQHNRIKWSLAVTEAGDRAQFYNRFMTVVKRVPLVLQGIARSLSKPCSC